jgi:hypothetical protein
MKTAEEMNELRALRIRKRMEMREWQKENTHELDHGYKTMPTIQSGGVGWELHPPQGSGGVRGEAPVFTGPVWYVNDLEEAKRKVEKHLRLYTGDGVFMPIA